MTRTHTKTYTLMGPWAETTPHRRNAANFERAAREGDPCCAPQCDELLRADEVVYAVVELEREDANPGRGEPWVCWRHVRPHEGPVKVPMEASA